jgi:hypothetical protein
MNNTNVNVTTIEELKQIGEGEIIELPPFDNGKTIKVRIRKPDITMMIFKGKIPNPLMKVAMKLAGEKVDDDKKNDKKEPDFEETQNYFQLLELVAKNCLLSPTYDEIEQYTGGLNLQQLVAILNYAQIEVNDLSSFRG